MFAKIVVAAVVYTVGAILMLLGIAKIDEARNIKKIKWAVENDRPELLMIYKPEFIDYALKH